MVPRPKVQLSNSEPDGSAAPEANPTYSSGTDGVAGPGLVGGGGRSCHQGGTVVGGRGG